MRITLKQAIRLATRVKHQLVALVVAGLATGVVSMPATASPVQINIIDVAGNLALTRPIFENYLEENPDKVSRFTYTKAPAPELAGKIKAMQDAGQLSIQIVLTGTDGLAAGMDMGLWENLKPYTDIFGKPKKIFGSGALALQKLAQMYGLLIAYSPQGPYIEYAPDRVDNVPSTIRELLTWCKAHPNRLMYARPANSGPGRTFLMALPYLLGDENPRDPVNGWDKTWAYLTKLDSCIEYYPSGTSATMKEFARGSRDIIITTMGWDIYPRVIGMVPPNAKVAMLDNTTFVSDGQFFVVPKGLSEEKLNVVLDVLKFMLTKKQQAIIYDSGYLYPGPSVKGVTLDMAPQKSQDVIAKYGRPFYDKLIKTMPIEVLLEPEAMITAFHEWDKRIGAR